MNDKDRYEVMFEQMLSETQAIRELVQDVPEIKQDIGIMKQDISEIRTDLSVLRVIAHDHETRVTTLEADKQAA